MTPSEALRQPMPRDPRDERTGKILLALAMLAALIAALVDFTAPWDGGFKGPMTSLYEEVFGVPGIQVPADRFTTLEEARETIESEPAITVFLENGANPDALGAPVPRGSVQFVRPHPSVPDPSPTGPPPSRPYPRQRGLMVFHTKDQLLSSSYIC